MAVPKIRIKGYTNEWSEKVLSQIATMHARIGWQNLRKDEFLSDGDYYLITGTDFIDGNVNYKTCHYVDEERYNQDKNIQLKNGSILVTKDGTLGKVAYIEKLDKPATLNAGVFNIVCRTEHTDSRYLFQYLKSPLLMNYVYSTAIGGTIKHLNQNVLVKFPVNIPCFAEQVFLGKFFQSLDSLIEVTSKKIATLKQTKQASLQSMFPQEGETKPRVRFKGFTDEWKKVEIGKYGDTYSGLSGKSKDDFGKGDAKYITFLNVLANAPINTSILESVDVKTGERQNAVLKGDILFNTSSETPEEVGLCSVLLEDIPNVYLNSFCFGFRPNNPAINSEFMVYLMRGHIGRSIMKVLAQGATRYNLSKKRLCETLIPIPTNIEEQKQIAEYFSNLDKQISIQEQRLEKLKQIKSACLKNMFV